MAKLKSFKEAVLENPALARKVTNDALNQVQDAIENHTNQAHDGILMLGVCGVCDTLSETSQKHIRSRAEVERILTQAA